MFRRIQTSTQGIPGIGAKIYKRIAAKILENFHNKVVEELVKLISNGPLLDIGCGTASILVKTAKRKTTRLLVGLDISKTMLSIALENLKQTHTDDYVDLILGDAHKLPFRNKSIEVILSTGTLHHLPNPETVFRECSRILKEKRSIRLIYDFSHDAPRNELEKSAKEIE